MVHVPDASDLEIFRDLFLTTRNAAVIDGKKILGHETADLFSDELILDHIFGRATVGAYFKDLSRVAVSIRPADPRGVHQVVRSAILAELEGFGVKAYLERRNNMCAVIHSFFEEDGGSAPRNFGLLPTWIAVERVRLQLAHREAVSFVIRPDTREKFGGALELPFAPIGGRFVDPARIWSLSPYKNQWIFLRSIERNSAARLWDTSAFLREAWTARNDRGELERLIRKDRPPPDNPWEKQPYAKLRLGHDEIYFGPWRRPDPSPYAVRRAYLQLRKLLSEVLQTLRAKDLPAVRCDIERVIEVLENNSPDGGVLVMDNALGCVHRAIDALLHESGLPPHGCLDFVKALGRLRRWRPD